MIITYHGAGFIKLVSGDLTVAFNPVGKESDFKETKFGADLAFVSLHHNDCNGIQSVSRSGKRLFVIDGPGEYEYKGVFAKGIGVTGVYDEKESINTIYSLYIEDVHIVNLGVLSDDKLGGRVFDGIDDDIDILFVPVGAGGTLDPASANKLANSLEAKIIVPTFYNEDTLNVFLKEAGAEDVELSDKLVLRKKDLENKSGEVIVLKV